jgi:hypothetical protein
MDQHVISAWHLRAFAGRGRGAQVVHVFEKTTDAYADIRVDEFLAEADAHSPEVELDLAHLEDPAARAARTLVKRARALPGGLYAVMEPDAAIQTAGPALTDEGVIEGMRLLVSRHEIPSPNAADRLALANYVALMYQRSPKGEAARVKFSIAYERAAQTILDRMMPGMRSGLEEAVSQRRARMLRNALDMGPILARANWWIVRAGAPEAFVLGDHPVVTTVSLGHDDTWRPIFAEATFVVAMPLGPAVALLIAPRVIVPISGIDGPDEVVSAINRLVWRSADRYVLARNREQLDRGLPDASEELRRSTVPVDVDLGKIARTAMAETAAIVAGVRFRYEVGTWQRWERCRLVFGYFPYASEDRHLFASPDQHTSGPPADPRTIGRMRRR